MISQLGQLLVLGGLAACSFGAVVGCVAGASGSVRAWDAARKAGIAFGALMIAANLLMVYALVLPDFSVKYVAEVGSRATPFHIAVVSLWSSLNGSILFWGGVLGVYVLWFLLANGKRHRAYMPWTIAVLLGVSVFFTLMVATVANPFEAMSPVPPDGPGPNPLLQNHWLMIVHPPTLYLGYVGMAVPFSMICAALLAGKLDAGWMVPLRRWMLVPWMFLTVGIVLGGWWSYAVLGWGGAWAWDPVENASFHPWLTGTAFLHSAMVLQRRGKLRVWTLVLGMATFLLTLVGTFMTRSGVFNSVHSFTQSDIGPVFLVFIGVVLVASILLLAFREHELAIPEDDARASTTLMRDGAKRKMTLFSRESSILLQNAVFSVFTFTVLLGTLYPLIAEAVQNRKVSVGEPYFDRWALPLGMMIIFLMGVGPALPWGQMSPGRFAKRMAMPAAFGVAFAGIAAALGFVGPAASATLFLVGFAFAANFAEFARPTQARVKAKGESVPTAASRVFKRSRRRWGGHIAHYGVLMLVASLAVYKGFKKEVLVTLEPGQTAQLEEWSVTYENARRDPQPHRESIVVSMTARRNGGDPIILEPRLNYYRTQREPIVTPGIHETPTGDLYLAITELQPEGEYVVMKIMSMPYMIWLWLAPFIIAFGSILAIWPAGGREERASAPASAEVA